MTAPTTRTSHPLLDELSWRGLLYQHTDGVAAALHAGVVSGYAGFDPTAPSLHVGNLVPIMGLLHLQRAGHRPVVLVGGGTGLIGDPSGRSSERALMTEEMVNANVRGIRAQLERFIAFDGPAATRGLLVDNGDWLRELRAVELMRDVGKHFTVNYMLQKESVKARMEAGISYTEFSYMLLQAYDFLELNRRHGVSLQLGGSDQWGNITAGTELIRRASEGRAGAEGLTLPLVTTASGAKFGKSEAGAVWLDAARTSPYKFYQYWLNADDRDIGRYLRFFSLATREAIEALDAETVAHPERRAAQTALAREMTARVHGEEALRAAEEVTQFFFGDRDARALSAAALEALREEAPYHEVASADVSEAAGGEIDVAKLLVAAKLASSNGAARRLLEQGGVSVNRRKLGGSERMLVPNDVLLAGGYVVVGKGKREFAIVRVG